MSLEMRSQHLKPVFSPSVPTAFIPPCFISIVIILIPYLYTVCSDWK